MRPGRRDPDLFGALAAAVEGVARTLKRNPASAVLFWDDPPEIEMVHQSGVPDEVCRVLSAAGGRHVASITRRAARPVRIPTRGLPAEAEGLAAALRAHEIPALAVFPLFGEMGIVGCLVVPLEVGDESKRMSDSWQTVCHALAGVQVAAGAAALRVMLAEDRRRRLGLCDGVLVVDRRERVLFAGGLFRDIQGWSRTEPFGRSLDQLPGGTLLSDLPVSKPGALEWQEHVLPPGDDSGVPVTLTVVPGRLLGGALDGSRVYLARDSRPGGPKTLDSTGRILALGLRVAHASDELLSAFASEPPGLREKAPGMLRALADEAKSAMRAVREVLERTVQDHERDRLDLNEAVMSVLERVRGELEVERVRVFSFLRPELEPVPGDPLEMLRALRTLVARTRESLRGGGGTLTLRTWLEDGWACAAISANGGGAGGGGQSAGFEPLFADPESGVDTELDEVRSTVERYGGRLQVECRREVWNRYTLMLPVERRRSAKPVIESETYVARARDGKLAVLVVDDNAALRRVLRRFLERRGHSVTEAGDGDEALDMVGAKDFDRVIVDVHMPGKTGPEFFESLSDVAPSMRARTLFMTGGFVEGDTERFIQASGRPAIRKPFDLAELANTVEGGG